MVEQSVCHVGSLEGMAPPTSGLLVSINLAQVRPDASEKYRHLAVKPNTGIDKRAASGHVSIDVLGAAGDTICDIENHGGVDQALYAYASEDAVWWQGNLGTQIAFVLHPGAFGENLTTRGIDVTNSVIGECWEIGGEDGVLVQVTRPRIPCLTFAGFWGVPHLVKTFTEAGRPGAYLRVLRPGSIAAGQDIEVTYRPDHGFTLGELFRAMTGDHSLARRVIEVPDVLPDIKERAKAWLRPAPAAEGAPEDPRAD